MHSAINSLVIARGNGYNTGSTTGNHSQYEYLHKIADIIYEAVLDEITKQPTDTKQSEQSE